MNIANSTSIRVADGPARHHRIRRHSVTVRITHWINVSSFDTLWGVEAATGKIVVMSGTQASERALVRRSDGQSE